MAKAASKQSVNTNSTVDENEEELSESYISIGLGLLVVVVVGILLYNYFTQKNTNNTTPESTSNQNITEEATTSAKPGSTYTVVEGDTLWSISEKSYGTGYNWSKIAEANDLSNSDQLEAGQELKIPEVSPDPSSTDQIAIAPTPEASAFASASPLTTSSPVQEAVTSSSPVAVVVVSPAASMTPTATPVPAQAVISGTSYTIIAGDTLWDIACRAYNDCYAWTKIAQANNLTEPNLIFSGNVLTLPR